MNMKKEKKENKTGKLLLFQCKMKIMKEEKTKKENWKLHIIQQDKI
jgi:hypothetical protein